MIGIFKQHIKRLLKIEDKKSNLMNEMKVLENKINKIQNQNAADYYRLQLMLWHVIKKLEETETVKDGKKEFFQTMEPAEGGLRKIQVAGKILLESFDRICQENGIEYWIAFGTLLGAVRHKGFIPWDDDTDVGMTRENAEKLMEIMKSGKYTDFLLKEVFVLSSSPARMNHQYQFYFAEKNTASYNIDIFVYEWSDHPGPEVEKKLNAIKTKMAEDVVAARTQENIKVRLPYDDPICSKIFEDAVKAEKAVLGNADTREYLVWAIDNTNLVGYVTKSSALSRDIFPLEEVEFEGRKYPAPKNSEAYLNTIYGDIYSLPADILTHSHTDYNKFTDDQKKVLGKIVHEDHESGL